MWRHSSILGLLLNNGWEYNSSAGQPDSLSSLLRFKARPVQKANAEVREMPHLNGSMVQFGLQLRCGQYLALQRLGQERGFSPGCARGARQGAPAHPANCSLKHDTEGEGSWGSSSTLCTLTTPADAEVELFGLLSAPQLLFIA